MLPTQTRIFVYAQRIDMRHYAEFSVMQSQARPGPRSLQRIHSLTCRKLSRARHNGERSSVPAIFAD